MTHETALLATIAVSLGFAFLFGFAAARLRAPPLVGYLLAGVAVGPFTPGFVANAGLASELAGIGVILLMFGESGCISRSGTSWRCAPSRCRVRSRRSRRQRYSGPASPWPGAGRPEPD